MGTMNISLPEALRDFVDEQVVEGGFGTSSEYVRSLIRSELDRQQLRKLLMDGLASGPSRVIDDAYFVELSEHARSFSEK